MYLHPNLNTPHMKLPIASASLFLAGVSFLEPLYLVHSPESSCGHSIGGVPPDFL